MVMVNVVDAEPETVSLHNHSPVNLSRSLPGMSGSAESSSAQPVMNAADNTSIIKNLQCLNIISVSYQK